MLYPLRAPERTVTIGEVATRCGLTLRAIRFYEEQGMIRSRRGEAGQRLYNDATLERLAFIATARRVGLSIPQVCNLLETGDAAGHAARIDGLTDACAHQLAQLDAQRRVVEETLASLRPRAKKASGRGAR
ncbi:MerR family redox-sensitive transcriptional activator SoxR [Caulobacter ginsengisoli]|uniref:MerR family redox-sensitive transcriptional activator SoxR n=1 Tax=Caulobacter ginsengisoli TaxID=400775 RepID=A0ABU0J0U3_9CAUL|nr:MerR family transcriptional regulator [Caulobacter ginsengisoli]MDQ0466919.1 MerR family redox-sensitive transcriptional activator SoxR [Caulobacter ginsengisoli]